MKMCGSSLEAAHSPLPGQGLVREGGGADAARSRTGTFFIVFNLFRLASILQGIMVRAIKGNASNALATEYGGRARAIAEIGWREFERMGRG